MFKYIIKRILIFIPTLLVVSLLTFALSSIAPGDPVEQMLSSQTGEGSSANLQANEQAYIEKRQELGLDLPIFYFSVGQMAVPDTLHRIPKRAHRDNLSRLINQHGNWNEISDYYYEIKEFEKEVYNVSRDSLTATPLINMKDAIKELYANYKGEDIERQLKEIPKFLAATPSMGTLQSGFDKLQSKHTAMTSKTSTWKNWIPSFKFYGTNNRYHHWFFGDKPWFGKDDGNWRSAGFVRGDFGISYKDQRPVSTVLWEAIRWTFGINIVAILITYLVAIPLGIFSARNKGSISDQVITTILFLLYALPVFWIGTLMIIYLCGGDYFDFFPPFFRPDLDGGLFSDIKELAYYLFLPMVCWVYAGFAYLSRQMRGGMLTVLGQDYIRTAKAKGLSENKIIWKHALRNSLLPIITLFASIFPRAIGGSIIIEILFSIPGMGKVGYEAVVARNYPIVFAVMMFASILTLVGYLVADILYAVVDPRISFNKK